MNVQELYDLLSKQLTEMETRYTKRFEILDSQLGSLDSRLRNVEIDIAEIKGRKAGWESARNWIATGISLVALGVAIAVALWK